MGANDKPKFLRMEWERTRETVLPEVATPTALEAARRLFYLGGLAVHQMIFEVIESAKMGNERAAQLQLNDLREELAEFGRGIGDDEVRRN